MILDIIQGKWREGLGLHVNGILHQDGTVVIFECGKLKGEGKTRPFASAIGNSTLESILSYDAHPWVGLTEMDRREYAGLDLRLACGECAMGNEGYVAVSNLNGGRLIWIAFFTCSNPFESVRMEEGVVVAENTYEQRWKFPLELPQSITIEAMD